ncbi:MAG TPA: hypothetical protein VGD59_05005 [Acidisarcina sp.]
MTLLDAPAYDIRRANLFRNFAIGALVLAVVLGALGWWFRDWPEQHRVERFMRTVESGDLAGAYGMWYSDPDWKQHPQKYSAYDFGKFQEDWGSGSNYGTIRSHQILMVKSFGNGVIVGLTINGGKTPIFLRVNPKTKEIGFSPDELYVGP